MNFLDKMERKIGKYAIPNLSLWLIVGYAIGFFLQFTNSRIIAYMALDPYSILHGQIWRLFTWVLLPNETDLFFAMIMMLFYYQLGTALERSWGTFRFNVYMFGGFLFTILGAFLLYFVSGCSILLYNPFTMQGYFNTGYINTSIFLAFATCFPEMQILLYFVIPVKMKWMAAVYTAITIYQFLTGGWVVRVAIVASLLNFIIFFLMTRKNQRTVSRKAAHRRKQYQAQQIRPKGITKHKCAVCGRTEESNPELEFRFCSKCEGNYEYCQDHLFTHQHVK